MVIYDHQNYFKISYQVRLLTRHSFHVLNELSLSGNGTYFTKKKSVQTMQYHSNQAILIFVIAQFSVNKKTIKKHWPEIECCQLMQKFVNTMYSVLFHLSLYVIHFYMGQIKKLHFTWEHFDTNFESKWFLTRWAFKPGKRGMVYLIMCL